MYDLAPHQKKQPQFNQTSFWLCLLSTIYLGRDDSSVTKMIGPVNRNDLFIYSLQNAIV
jgi:hypothetical protein